MAQAVESFFRVRQGQCLFYIIYTMTTDDSTRRHEDPAIIYLVLPK